MRKCEIITDSIQLQNTHCLISHINLEEALNNKNTVIKLGCGHCFIYSEFMKSFIINNKNIYSYYKCPYCNSDIAKPPVLIKKNKSDLK